MKHTLQIGITGGIGSGKSLVSKIFAVLGIPVYDADSRAKNLMTTDRILRDQIAKEFGNLCYHPDGRLNNAYLASVVFKAPERLLRLNQLVHPRVAEDYHGWVIGNEQSPYVIKEAALLFEAGSYKALDKIIVVTAPVDMRIDRVLKRDQHRTKEDVQRILKSQMAEEEKIELADFVILNDGTQLVIPQVLALHKQFVSQN